LMYKSLWGGVRGGSFCKNALPGILRHSRKASPTRAVVPRMTEWIPRSAILGCSNGFAVLLMGRMHPVIGYPLATRQDNSMTSLDILKGKRLLVVDDELDVLETIEEQLSQCRLTSATDYETASKIIASESFDLAILDIMGVNGFALLKECHDRNIPAVMLTAHSITVESVNKALKLGAVSFLPKEEMASFPILVREIFEELAAGHTHWKRLFERMGPFFREKLGLSWKDLEKPPSPPYMY
jgi:CheY-like chemotaxis protein